MISPSSSRARLKLGIVAAVVCIICPAVLIARLFYIQLINGDKYKQMAVDQQLRDTVISPHRGSIYDANMNTLAQSANVWNVVFEPANLNKSPEKAQKEVDTLVTGLAPILGIDPQVIRDAATKENSYYQVLKKKVDKETFNAVTEFIQTNNKKAKEKDSNAISINTINLEQDTKRYYPYEDLASTVLGFTKSDNRGAYGLESYYNKVLSGIEGRVVTAKNALNGDMPFKYQKLYESQDGNSLVLTIDETVQHFVEKHLEVAVREHEVKERAIGVAMNIKTGEILAMSTKPDFDPNNPRELKDPTAADRLQAARDAVLGTEEEKQEAYLKQLDDEQNRQWRNKVISDPYEPGSVFKLITASAALDTGSCSLSNSYYCPGYRQVADNKIHCWKLDGGHGSQTFTQAMMHSCNPAFIDIGQATGVHNFSTYFDRFGFTEITGIDLPGEAEGLYHPESEMGIPELSSSAFGQTFRITSIQLITAVSAALNDGNLMQPYIVKQIIDSDKNIVETYSPQVKRQVISKETSIKVRELGEAVVGGPLHDNPSGKYARIPGYRIGGKTGTSEKLDNYGEMDDGNGNMVRYFKGGNVLSFLGFAPADDPQIAVLVAMDEPVVGNAQSSTIAVPVVGAMLEDILPYLGFEPTYTAEEEAEVEVKVGNHIGKKPHEAQQTIRLDGLKTEIVGQGMTVIKQIPDPGKVLPKGGTVLLYTDESELNTEVEVPDIVGMTAQQASQAATNASLNLVLSGENLEGALNVIVSQSPEAGTKVPMGSTVTGDFVKKEEETPTAPAAASASVRAAEGQPESVNNEEESSHMDESESSTVILNLG